jgi:hypothetical protein
MLVIVLLSHAGDGTASQGCTGHVMVAQPRAQSIEVLLQCEEVRLTRQSLMMFVLAHNRVIAGKIS